MSPRVFTEAEKDFIVADVHNRLSRWIGTDHLDGACLFWAGFARGYLNAHYNVGAELVAGTMSWRAVAEEDDDGRSPTHFSYVWEPDHPLSQAALERGLLPEMHVWVTIPATGEIIDLSTRYFANRATRFMGIRWTAPKPPPYLWSATLPEGVLYAPDPLATVFAGALFALQADDIPPATSRVRSVDVMPPSYRVLPKQLPDGRIVVDELCTCTHRRTRHAGLTYHGLCLVRGCRCGKFTWAAWLFLQVINSDDQ